MSNRELKVGESVTYYDEYGRPRPALCTEIHGKFNYDEEGTLTYAPCINVVFVCQDAAMRDNYGRQIGRESSVSHRGDTQAHGRFWDYPDA